MGPDTKVGSDRVGLLVLFIKARALDQARTEHAVLHVLGELELECSAPKLNDANTHRFTVCHGSNTDLPYSHSSYILNTVCVSPTIMIISVFGFT